MNNRLKKHCLVSFNSRRIKDKSTFLQSQQNDLGNITLISSRPRDLNTEPQCLVEWRKKQEERIKLKDEEEARKKNELREKARQELESWYDYKILRQTDPIGVRDSHVRW